MPGFLFDVAARLTCPHAAQVTTSPDQPRVKVLGQPVATAADASTVAGCPFTVGPNPSPCVTVEWLQPATRVKAGGQPVLLQTSLALARNPQQVPQGSPVLVAGQSRVRGT